MTDDQKAIETHAHRMAGLLADIITGADPEDMRVLLREAEEAVDDWRAAAASLEAQEPVAYGLQWPGDRAAGIINWRTTFGTEEAAKEYAAGCGHADGITVAPLYRHPPTSLVPEGWKLVPVEPTPEMVDRGAEEVDWYNHNARDCYGAMLAAAPQQARSE